MVSQQLLNIIIKAQDQASSTAKKVDESLKQIGKSSSMLSKVPGFDTMRNKLSSVAQTIDGKFGGALTRARNRFSSFKNTVSGVAGTVKGKFGGAIDGMRQKLANFGKSARQAGNSLGFLKSAGSMAVGMLGYELVSSLVETTRASLNARSGMQAFAQRLKMSQTEVQSFQKSLDEMQNEYKKIDMDVVGQQATDMAYRLGLPKQSLSELTETTAIFTDAMQRNGRSAEDSMLAMSDAMDGQFVRLKEIGIGQDDLMKNGWSGDINDKTGLLKAMNKALKEQHYDDLAKSVDTLDDAWQVLSVTMSNLLETIILPLTPAIVGVVTGITDAISGIKDAWNSLPDWGKYAIGVGALAVAIGILVPALMAAEAASLPLVGTLMAVAGAVTAISLPVVAVVAAVGLLAAAIYEIGNAFGWWTDVGSMIDAICAGLQRMWNAFINHPDVQAAIKAIGDAFNWIVGAIGNAWNAVLQFFGVSSSSKFDAVHAIILGLGFAWDTIKTKILLVMSVVTALWNVFTGAYDALQPFGAWLMESFAPVWSFIAGTVQALMPIVDGLIGAFSSFQAGQMSLPGLIMTIMSSLWNIYVTILSRISQAVINWVSSIVGNAASGASRFVMSIVSRIMSLPMRFLSYLNQTKLQIMAQMLAWVTLAKARIASFVNGIVSKVKQLPGKVYSALIGVVSRISSAIQSWISAAKSKVQGVVNAITGPFKGVASAISGALSGVVSAITKPFQDAWNAVKPLVDKIKGAMDLLPMGGESAYGGESINDVNGNSFNINTGSYTGTGELNITVDNNLVLDLRNVPAHISTDALIGLLKDPEVLKALVYNPEFQDLDKRVKEKLNLKQVRSRGR